MVGVWKPRVPRRRWTGLWGEGEAAHGLHGPFSSEMPVIFAPLDEEHGLEQPSSETSSDQRPELASLGCN